MPHQAHIELINVLHKSKQTLRLYLNTDLQTDFFEECFRMLHRQVVMDLYFSKICLLQLENNPFVFNKLFELKTRGANVYVNSNSDYITQYKWISQIDFKSTFALNQNESINQLNFSQTEEIFTSIQKNSSEYRLTDSGIRAQFESQSYNVIKGKSTTISWDIKEADSVSIDGFGEVSSSGKKVVQVLDNTLLTLKASNRKERKFKAIYLRAIESLEINFDVLFLNLASKKFVSLKTEGDSDGVFGVSKEHKIKVIWNVPHAETVEVQPFGFGTKSGAHTFMPEGTSEINIKASLQEQVVNQRIIIHQYPMPIFAEELVKIKRDFYNQTKFSYKDMRGQAFLFVNDKRKLDSLEELKAKVSEQEEILLEKFKNLNFSKFYEEHSISKLNNTIFGRLKAYFSDRPEVKKMLDTLQQYEDVE